jgi:hypothetical protein
MIFILVCVRTSKSDVDDFACHKSGDVLGGKMVHIHCPLIKAEMIDQLRKATKSISEVSYNEVWHLQTWLLSLY